MWNSCNWPQAAQPWHLCHSCTLTPGNIPPSWAAKERQFLLPFFSSDTIPGLHFITGKPSQYLLVSDLVVGRPWDLSADPQFKAQSQLGKWRTGYVAGKWTHRATKRSREGWRKALLCPWCPSSWSPRQFFASRWIRIWKESVYPRLFLRTVNNGHTRHSACF